MNHQSPQRPANVTVTVLRLQNVRTWFPVTGGRGGTIRAVDGVSLELRKGEVLGLVGESGCGKTTLSRAILRLAPVTSGSILWNGQELTGLSGGELRRLRPAWQIVFQDPYGSLNPRLTVQDTLGEAMRRRYPKRRGTELQRAVGDLLEQVGLARRYLRRYPHEFSGGQRQRIAIARALATEPELLIADEPVSALDVSVQAQILNLLNDIRRERELTMLFVSHDLSVVQYLADRIAVMNAGQLVEYGPAEAVMMNPLHSYTRALLQAIPRPEPHRRHQPRATIKAEPADPYAPADAPARPEPTFREAEASHFVAESAEVDATPPSASEGNAP
ncbi:MAG: ATP-binding cassette domain-containing protein [Opitutales bacterium]